MCHKKSTVEGHRKVLQIVENLDAWVLVESDFVLFWVGAFRVKGAVFGVGCFWVCGCRCLTDIAVIQYTVASPLSLSACLQKNFNG